MPPPSQKRNLLKVTATIPYENIWRYLSHSKNIGFSSNSAFARRLARAETNCKPSYVLLG
jgi:hypothetical protein